MYKKILLGSWLLVAVLMSSNVSAGSYWGAGIGNASYDLKVLGVLDLEDGSAIRIFGGNRNDDFGVEFEFSFSEHDWKGTGGQATHNVGSLILSGVGYHSLSEGFDLYGKLGLNLWNTTVDVLGTNFDGDDGIGLALGFGLDVAATDQFHIRLEYQLLNGIGDAVDEGDVTQMTVNGAYFF